MAIERLIVRLRQFLTIETFKIQSRPRHDVTAVDVFCQLTGEGLDRNLSRLSMQLLLLSSHVYTPSATVTPT